MNHPQADRTAFWMRLSRDRFVRLVLVLLALLVPLYALPVMTPQQRERFSSEDWADVLLILVSLTAFIAGLRRVAHLEEKRFRSWMGVAFGCLAVACLLYLFGPAEMRNALIVDFLYLLFYLACFFAIDSRPHLRSGWSSGNPSYGIEEVGALVFSLGMLSYFVLIPSYVNRAFYDTFLPSSYLYLAFDILLVLRVTQWYILCDNPRWKLSYAMLGVVFAIWSITDFIECLKFAQVIDLRWGTALDFLWYAPYLAAVLAARAPFYSRGVTEQVGTPPAGLRQQLDATTFGGLLLVYALLQPVIHLVSYSFDLLHGAGLPQRRVVVLASLLSLGTLALLQQTLQKKYTRRLQAELEAATERLHQSERLEAIGRLAGGVAHDFNNLLTAVIGYGDLLAEGLEGQDRLQAYAQEIRRAADRAATLTRQLLAYGRRQMLVPELVDLGDVVSNLLPLLGSLLGETVRLDVQREPDLAKVRVDAAQIEQVIVNLALNARDAMPGGGTLTIETANLARDQKAADAVTDGGSGRSVQLVVRDAGHGMDAATLKRIFEPFFTTKEVGKGTGLGLSTVYGIVSQSGGTIDVESQLGTGTTFRICFPEAPVDADSGASSDSGASLNYSQKSKS